MKPLPNLSEGQMYKHAVCAVLVSYHPGPSVIFNIEKLRSQIDHVIVVDNTPENAITETINAIEHLPGCTVIRNGKNLGIAAALNIGIRHAIALRFSWVITFDQDSQITDGYMANMFSTYDDASVKSKVGILYPRYKDARLDIPLPSARRSTDGHALSCITSGSMIQSDTFKLLGPMDEQLFIDYVDIEYSLRMRAAGFAIVESSNSMLLHSLGHIAWRHILGKTCLVTNHSAQRRYYITRNRLFLMKKYLFIDMKWACIDSLGIMKDIIKIVLFEKNKILKARYIARAVYDAAFNRLGQRVAL